MNIIKMKIENLIGYQKMEKYNGNTYYLKIAYAKRNDDPKLSDVYRIETSKINVGDSVASAQAIFKVIDSKEQLDKKDIKLMAKYTY